MTIRRADWLTAGAVVSSLALAACGGSAGAENGPAEAPGETARVINVRVERVQPGAFVEDLRLTGTVAAARDVTVSAEESGVVREIMVEKGAAVRAGQPILRIDDRVLAPQVEQARAQAELARETWERRRRLWEEDQVGSELAYLEARYAAEQAAANLAMLVERLARTVVRAPIEGVLDDRMVEIGTMVSPGTPLVRVIDVDPVKILAGVPERYATDVQRGAAVRVSFDVLEGSFEGTIGYVGAAVNPRNRTFPVEFTVPNPGRAIKPEMVANLSVVRRTLDEVVVVPQEAVIRISEGYAVFVVREEGGREVAHAVPVQLGASQANRVVVTSGLEPGERLVVVGQAQVAHGDYVRVLEDR